MWLNSITFTTLSRQVTTSPINITTTDTALLGYFPSDDKHTVGTDNKELFWDRKTLSYTQTMTQ